MLMESPMLGQATKQSLILNLITVSTCPRDVVLTNQEFSSQHQQDNMSHWPSLFPKGRWGNPPNRKPLISLKGSDFGWNNPFFFLLQIVPPHFCL